MPRKVRELRADLRRAGFTQVKGGGKGSHTKWQHPKLKGSIIVSGQDGDDADRYQEQDIRLAITIVKGTP